MAVYLFAASMETEISRIEAIKERSFVRSLLSVVSLVVNYQSQP